MYVKVPPNRFFYFCTRKQQNSNFFKQFNMKKISVIALVGVGLLLASCNKGKSAESAATAQEQTVA